MKKKNYDEVTEETQNELVLQEDKKIRELEVKAEENKIVTREQIKQEFMSLAKSKGTDARTIQEVGNDFLRMASMGDLSTKQEFMDEYQKKQKDIIIKDLRATGEAEAIRNAAKKQKEKNIRNQAYYDSLEPLFRDFIGIDKPFGLIPMILITLVLLIPYIILSTIFNVIKFIVNGLNEVFTAITGFVKPAQLIASFIIYILIAVFLAFAIGYGLEYFFGVNVPYL